MILALTVASTCAAFRCFTLATTHLLPTTGSNLVVKISCFSLPPLSPSHSLALFLFLYLYPLSIYLSSCLTSPAALALHVYVNFELNILPETNRLH